MTTIEHSIFGAIDPSKPGVWEATAPYERRNVVYELVIDEEGLETDAVVDALRLADDLPSLDATGREAIRADSSNSESAASLYAEHHFEELPEDRVRDLLGGPEPSTASPTDLLAKLAIVRVAFHPESQDARVRLDYSLAGEVTDYVLCVTIDAEGVVSSVEMES
mgnify:CR=1 FL=1